jgi:hypothetical protein
MTTLRPTPARRLLAAVLSASLALPAWAQPPAVAARPALVTTEQVLPGATPRTGDAAREALQAHLEREDLAQALASRGLSAQAARERVAALTDDEARALVDRIDAAPAGASEVLSTLLFVFVLLLITDILGFTKVFPFTRSVR